MTARLGGRSLVMPRCTHVDDAPNQRTRVPAYARVVATATPSTTPNPDAMKFTLDTDARGDVQRHERRRPQPINRSPLPSSPQAVSPTVFGVNDFVTVTRQPGADWEPIIAAVQEAASAHL